MALPGKLTVSFLHEDNPLKSFFRMKPLLTEEAGGLESSNIDERFPEEGFIRIVPDKNEIVLFKSRMRQLGRYCCLDLRKHLNENDKIRPNKNFILGGPERNQYIVYSDVIGRVPPHLVAELIDLDRQPSAEQITVGAPAPGTYYVVARHDGRVYGPWTWMASDSGEGPALLTLSRAQDQPFSEHAEDEFGGKILTVPLEQGAQALLLYNLAPFGLVEIALPEMEIPMPLAYEPARAQMSAALDDYRAMESAAGNDLGPKPEDAPWLMRGEAFRSRVAGGRVSFREQALQAQSGINPRRGRSLHEIVDEQWRKSRYDQLGHPVPTQAQGRPLASPVERAAMSVNEAWALGEARPGLIAALLKNEELKEALLKNLELSGQRPGACADLNSQLNEIEANRLKLIGEIDALRFRRDETKNQLMEELRQAHRQEFSEYERRTRALKSEIERNEQVAQDASHSAELAERLMAEAVEKLDERLMSSFVGQRLFKLMDHTRGARGGAHHPETYEPTAGELISDVRIHMERAGFPLTNDEAVNLLACMMSGGTLIFSGASGSGKSELSRRLADVLGLRGRAGRFVEARMPSEDGVVQLFEKDDRITPLMVLLDDFNTGDCHRRMLEILELQETISAKGTPMSLILTAQDSPEGRPLPSRLLGRSFLIRLKGAPATAEWKPGDLTVPAPERAVSLSALNRIFAREAELPGEITERLGKLRAALDKLGWALDRRTLNELWYYCAAAQGLMQCSGLELLDLALSQRALPAMLASMELEALHELPNLLADMPRCLSLMDQPLPLPPL